MGTGFLIIGYGSIGRRHLRNLRALGYHDAEIIVCRTGHSTLPEDELAGVTVEYDLEKALAYQPQATIIANPTAFHLQTALIVARSGSHILIEKPISQSLAGIEELGRLVDTNALVFEVGFQFRFHPGLRQIAQWLSNEDIGRVTSVQAHWGEYLPDWHPWEDYRHSYSAREDLGGGVVLTLSHPLDYVRWLFGEVISVSAALGYGGLDIEAEDTADIYLEFEKGTRGYIHLDYIQRPSSHWISVTGTEGSIRWDNADGVAQCYRVKSQQWEVAAPPSGFERNTMFIEEMRHFLACVRGEEPPVCSFQDGVRTLQVALAAKQSARQRKVVAIK